MLYVERATQRRCTCFKFQVSGLKLIYEVVLELVFELVFVVTSNEVENYRKDFTQSCTEFF